MRRIAALYVLEDGPYASLPAVDVWGPTRDARLYCGPYPAVAHPPCERWGRYSRGGPSTPNRYVTGEDGGCFSAALEAVRRFGGVLEHPADSAAWDTFGLKRPPRAGGWVSAGLFDPGWTCCVDQGHYGHRAQKRTWLYSVGCDIRGLAWGDSPKRIDPRAGRKAVRRGVIELMSKRQRASTPPAFRDLLVALARSAQ